MQIALPSTQRRTKIKLYTKRDIDPGTYPLVPFKALKPYCILTLIFLPVTASELGQEYFCFGSMKMFVSSRTKAWLRYFFRYFRRRSYRLSVTCHNSLRRWSSGIILTFYSIYTQISFHMITTLHQYSYHLQNHQKYQCHFYRHRKYLQISIVIRITNISKHPFLSS